MREMTLTEACDSGEDGHSKLVVTLIEVIEHIVQEKHGGLLENLH